MRILLCACLLVLLPAAAQAELPGDAAEGKSLHDIYCTACHDTGVYTRQDRRIRSLDALRQQLKTCERAAGTNFSAKEKQDVLKYLNDRFYRLP
jgi:cytochrome c553